MKNTALKRALSTVVVLGTLGTAVLATAGSASAVTRDGYLDIREFGLFYNSSLGGSFIDLYMADGDLANDRFISPGPGQGYAVGNNAASYFNKDKVTWYVYTGASAGGIEGWIPADRFGTFSDTFKNEVSSVYHFKAR
ncbi:hypothetical protein AB0B13_14165 [Streptomyces sp. NPDC042898]|uniref:hypothetical protein n=1 Tax=unclassified Streptomyces TaxID=2593676 RepID=UPI00332B935C